VQSFRLRIAIRRSSALSARENQKGVWQSLSNDKASAVVRGVAEGFSKPKDKGLTEFIKSPHAEEFIHGSGVVTGTIPA
jgi:hypothetical protein